MFTAAVPQPTGKRPPAHELAENIARFGVDLYRAIAAEEHGNIALSPYSIAVALSMAWHGATGETADEITKALHQNGSPAEAHRQLAAALRPGPSGGALILDIANTLWVQHGLHLDSGFADALRDGYTAGPQWTDFIRAAEAARQEINRVIAGQTRGRIPDLLGPDAIGRRTRLVLANACYLLLRWAEPFPPEATTEQPFRVPGREPVAVPMMRRTGVFGYLRGDGFDERRAEFTGITHDEPLHLSAVVHGIDLEVDERGAEAAAATAAVISTVSLTIGSREVTVDRPFLFAITHSATGLPLLFGRVQHPLAP